METYIILLIMSKILLVIVTCQTPKHPWEPEPDEDISIPDESSDLWKTKNKRANYTGLLYASRLSYNWIVYVELTQEDHKNGAIGNLISEKVVLSNCRVGNLIIKGHESYVIYATQYLHEKHVIHTRYGTYDVEGVHGKQPVGKATVHPSCSPKIVEWDVSILEVWTPIRTLVPLIGLMPVAIDYRNRRIRPFKFPYQSEPKNERTVCYVGSFGRQSYNNPQPLDTDDFKVQYRVYSLPMIYCSRHMKLLCAYDERCKSFTIVGILEKSDVLRCYGTRAKVGGVCDQDRGAPIVCDGEVVAIVLRGAQWKFCNNLIHLPFFAQGLDTFTDYFEDFVHQRVFSPKLIYSRSEAVCSILCLYFIIVPFLVHFVVCSIFS